MLLLLLLSAGGRDRLQVHLTLRSSHCRSDLGWVVRVGIVVTNHDVVVRRRWVPQ